MRIYEKLVFLSQISYPRVKSENSETQADSVKKHEEMRQWIELPAGTKAPARPNEITPPRSPQMRTTGQVGVFKFFSSHWPGRSPTNSLRTFARFGSLRLSDLLWVSDWDLSERKRDEQTSGAAKFAASLPSLTEGPRKGKSEIQWLSSIESSYKSSATDFEKKRILS